MKKFRDLMIITLVYVLAYLVGYYVSQDINNVILRVFVFDTVATVVTFIFSTILSNSSVYDPYWSLTPLVIAIYLYVFNEAFGTFQLLFLFVFLIWAIRLTVNWIIVFTDFNYEDWR